jgi:hypothetical protein
MKSYKTDIHPGIFLGFLGVLLEVMVLGAVAILCSTFTTSFISAFICAAVYFSGHLSTEFLRVVRKSHGVRRFVGEAIYYLVPNLERFNFKYNATYDVTVASGTLLAVVLFGLAYSGAALLGAVIVFQRRDFR